MNIVTDAANERDVEASEVERLRAEMEAQRAAVDPTIASYVSATLSYGVAQVRSEYRRLANRNWRQIVLLGRRLTGLLAVLVVALAVIGVLTLLGVQGIKAARHERIRENCIHGQRFMLKLEAEDRRIPPGAKRKEAEASIAVIRELITALNGPIGKFPYPPSVCDQAAKHTTP